MANRLTGLRRSRTTAAALNHHRCRQDETFERSTWRCTYGRPSFMISLLLMAQLLQPIDSFRAERLRFSSRLFFGAYSGRSYSHRIIQSSALAVSSSTFYSQNDEQRQSKATESRSFAYSNALEQLQSLKRDQASLMNDNNFRQSSSNISEMVDILRRRKPGMTPEEYLDLSDLIDSAINAFTVLTFRGPITGNDDVARVMYGVKAIHFQLDPDTVLQSPYNSVPRGTMLSALSALTALNQKNQDNSQYLYESYRILQRLITGRGVRQSRQSYVSEKDFTQVLNAFVEAGQMQMAHRIVALQERAGPQVSTVAYSILIKGYGRLHDKDNIDWVVEHAKRNDVSIDVIMLNTLIDAYINSGAFEDASRVFEDMKFGEILPNRRTFNIMLKGLANEGNLEAAKSLSNEMKQVKKWDSISTNTLVHAAVVAGDLAFANHVLVTDTMESNKKYKQHPNVQAYTELLNVHAKQGFLDKSLAVLKEMRNRGVQPNEVTYTCLMGGLGRHQKIDLSNKMFLYMNSTGVSPSNKMYNSLISGLVCDAIPSPTGKVFVSAPELDTRVDQGMSVLRDMMKSNVAPNFVTVSILVEALGRCNPPRDVEASLLVEKLERKGYIMSGNLKVVTALVRTMGKGGNVERAIEIFETLNHPDAIAVNTLLDVCFRSKREDLVVQLFNSYYGQTSPSLSPDVVSYSIVIASLLQKGTLDCRRQALTMYEHMKTRSNVLPDSAMVDVILKSMIHLQSKTDPVVQLRKCDASLVATVLRDAKKISWDEGQFERRERAARSILFDHRLRDSWRSIDMVRKPSSTKEDALFQRKGWNTVDSGFRLWGGGTDAYTEHKESKKPDSFLKSHGWNDVDSGFRLV